MFDFEKLGAFYLGKRVDSETDKLTDELVLYDSKDLTTHAVIIGMTGSGKTGLGIALLEEAALDHIPVIAIDPKGDLGNLLLTFPELRPEDFRPWIDSRQAAGQGRTLDDHAKSEALLWSNGLAEWGQDGARIATLRSSTDMAIYTPGSSAGLPISLLASFAAPPPALLNDADLYRERVAATVTGLLSLLGIDADPVNSREHILLSRILDEHWKNGRDLDVANLIAAVQTPPFATVGVMQLDSFYPPADRFALAMRLNNLLASPGFAAWTEGEALDASRLLYTDQGKPRISVLSIAHLSDAERMFFVTMLLNELIAWMRAQQGTSSLRAILYMDEIFGYLPPVANPPSKLLFLTLLKQARAYGLGLVLATQNPVDLDYKGLSNAGTWFIGRLQTERDQARVLDGLAGAGGERPFDRRRTQAVLSGLGKRRFLLHNVHESGAVVFGTRWVMSYLAGPMTREQIRSLMAEASRTVSQGQEEAAPAVPAATAAGEAPLMPPSIRQYFLPGGGENIVYYPRLVAAAEVVISSTRHALEERRSALYAVEIGGGPLPVDWDSAERLSLGAEALRESGTSGARYAECPPVAAEAARYREWQAALRKWLQQNECIRLLKSARFRLTSNAGETEGEFRVRLQQAAAERRDSQLATLRKRYAAKAATLEKRLLRARQAVERESGHAGKQNLNAAVSVGTAILGAVLGRKKLSSATAGRVGTAIRSAGSARKKASDVARARETEQSALADMEHLDAELAEEIETLEGAYDAQAEELTEILVKPKATDIAVPLIGLLWLPYRETGDGRLQEAWRLQ